LFWLSKKKHTVWFCWSSKKMIGTNVVKRLNVYKRYIEIYAYRLVDSLIFVLNHIRDYTYLLCICILFYLSTCYNILTININRCDFRNYCSFCFRLYYSILWWYSIIVRVFGELTSLSFAIAVVCPPWVVTSLGDTPVLARVNQAIWTVVQLRLSIHTFPVTIAVSRIRYHLVFSFAWIFLYVGWLQLLLAKAWKHTSWSYIDFMLLN